MVDERGSVACEARFVRRVAIEEILKPIVALRDFGKILGIGDEQRAADGEPEEFREIG